jgi:mediator of RNA polymerase II transcription subunit 31
MTTTLSSPPPTPSPRFTLELEFVLSLSNPYYLQHLATTYPHLFSPSTSTTTSSPSQNFTAYLSYLYSYWSTPQYAKYLTHAPAVLHTLKLLQEERFRREVIRPDVVEGLLRGGRKGEEMGGGEEGQEGRVEAVGPERNAERMDEGAG